MRKERSKPYVIVISGSVGSGKTTLVRKLAEMLEDAPVLIFDQYDQYAEWPRDMEQWIQTGMDPNQIRVPRLKEDLLSLLEGTPIRHPLDNSLVKTSTYILIEEPSGRERQEIAEYIDLVIYVDVPQDVCVVRVAQRALGVTGVEFGGTVEGESRDDLVKRLKAGGFWLAYYLRMRPVYIGISNMVKQKADIVVDGMGPVEKVVQNTLDAIENLQMKVDRW